MSMKNRLIVLAILPCFMMSCASKTERANSKRLDAFFEKTLAESQGKPPPSRFSKGARNLGYVGLGIVSLPFMFIADPTFQKFGH
jgi:hypothetical protein